MPKLRANNFAAWVLDRGLDTVGRGGVPSIHDFKAYFTGFRV